MRLPISRCPFFFFPSSIFPSRRVKPFAFCSSAFLLTRGNHHLHCVFQFRRKNHSPYGETAFQHLDGRSGNGREAIASYLKMKAAMQAALALQKFKGLQAAKKSAPSEPVAAQ